MGISVLNDVVLENLRITPQQVHNELITRFIVQNTFIHQALYEFKVALICTENGVKPLHITFLVRKILKELLRLMNQITAPIDNFKKLCLFYILSIPANFLEVSRQLVQLFIDNCKANSADTKICGREPNVQKGQILNDRHSLRELINIDRKFLREFKNLLNIFPDLLYFTPHSFGLYIVYQRGNCTKATD